MEKVTSKTSTLTRCQLSTRANSCTQGSPYWRALTTRCSSVLFGAEWSTLNLEKVVTVQTPTWRRACGWTWCAPRSSPIDYRPWPLLQLPPGQIRTLASLWDLDLSSNDFNGFSRRPSPTFRASTKPWISRLTNSLREWKLEIEVGYWRGAAKKKGWSYDFQIRVIFYTIFVFWK